MHLLRAASLCVSDLNQSIALYRDYLDYQLVERHTLTQLQAESWNAPQSAGTEVCVLQPRSGADIFLRLIEQPSVADYQALRTFGWAAIEICVQDVLAVNERIQSSPFEVVGPPRKIEGLDAIHPMQVKGYDEEIVYLTQINSDLPTFALPRAQTPIDHLFILVLGCSDRQATQQWFIDHIGLQMGREMDIVYTMLAHAFETPVDQLYTISTLVHERDVFLELDQYPDAATNRPKHAGMLPPGPCIATLKVPDLSQITAEWIKPPQKTQGSIYQGKRSGTVLTPDHSLLELVEIQ